YRSTDGGQNFRRADFPDRGVQVWSFLHDDTDPKLMLAGGSPVSVYRSEDGGASLEAHARSPFAAPRDDAVFVSCDAVRTTSSPSCGDFCRARSLRRNALDRWRRKLERL